MRTWTQNPPQIRGDWTLGGNIPMIDTRNHIRWKADVYYGWAGSRTLVIRVDVSYWRGISGESYAQRLQFDESGFTSSDYSVTPTHFYPQDDPQIFTVYLVDTNASGTPVDVGIYDYIRQRQATSFTPARSVPYIQACINGQVVQVDSIQVKVNDQIFDLDSLTLKINESLVIL